MKKHDIITPNLTCYGLLEWEDDPLEVAKELEAQYKIPRVFLHHPVGEWWLYQSVMRSTGSYVLIKQDPPPHFQKLTSGISPRVSFLPAGKIPFQFLLDIGAFFKAVMASYKEKLEAMIWICWSEDRGYHLIIPNQVVAGASATYDWASLPEGSTIIVDIHSHDDG